MAKIQILQRLANTKINNDKSKEILGRIVRNEFDRANTQQRAFELLTIAFKWNLPVLNEMIDDYSFEELSLSL